MWYRALMELDQLAYTVNATADMLGISRSRMYKLMELGEIFYIQPGGHRMIPAEAIRAFLRGEHYDPNTDKQREQQADTTTWPPTPSVFDVERAAAAEHAIPAQRLGQL